MCWNNDNFLKFQPRSPLKTKSDNIVVDQHQGSPSEAGGFLKVAKDNGNGSRCSTPTEVNSPLLVTEASGYRKVANSLVPPF